MKPNFFNPLFRPAETEKPAAGSPSAKPAAGKTEGTESNPETGGDGEGEEGEGSEGEEDEPEAPPAAGTSRLGIFDRAALHLKSKNAVITLLGEAHKFNGQLAAENEQLRGQLAAANATKDKVATLQKQLAEAGKEKTTVAKEVAKELTSLGIPEKEAPSMANSEAITTRQQALEAYAAAKTPEEQRKIYNANKKFFV
jgi:hypothetical protein